jgi:hypothetical protein
MNIGLWMQFCSLFYLRSVESGVVGIPSVLQAERRIDPMLDGRAVTYAEMCAGLENEPVTAQQFRVHWANLHPAQALKHVGSNLV